MFRAVADGRIKALWIMATNPVVSMPDAGAVEAAIKACPFVVVSDVMASTDTARHAHVLLPSLGWGEKDGTVTNSERRISRQRGFLDAPGEAKADWWQMAEVGRRMGFDAAFAYRPAIGDFCRTCRSFRLSRMPAVAISISAGSSRIPTIRWRPSNGRKPEPGECRASPGFSRMAGFTMPMARRGSSPPPCRRPAGHRRTIR